MAEAGIDPREFSFSFDAEGPDDIITLYHPLSTFGERSTFLQLAYGAVYNLLGERSFGIDLRLIKMANLSDADGEDVYPLEELPIHMGSRKFFYCGRW